MYKNAYRKLWLNRRLQGTIIMLYVLVKTMELITVSGKWEIIVHDGAHYHNDEDK